MRRRWASLSRRPAQLSFALDPAFVEFNAHPWSGWHRYHATNRLQRIAEEELVDLIPLDQIFQDRAQRGRLGSDELGRGGGGVAVRDQHELVGRGQRGNL